MASKRIKNLRKAFGPDITEPGKVKQVLAVAKAKAEEKTTREATKRAKATMKPRETQRCTCRRPTLRGGKCTRCHKKP